VERSGEHVLPYLLLDKLREAVALGRIQWHYHAALRCLQRDISRNEVVAALTFGDAIEVYEQDVPFPSCLLLYVDKDPVHVVAAVDPEALICHVITVYRPSLLKFEGDLKTRKKHED
jgi:hypothetical protein